MSASSRRPPKPLKPPKPRRNTGLLFLAALIMLLLLMEGILVAVSFISPDTARGWSANVGKVADAWNGTEGKPGIPQRVSASVDRFWDTQVVTLWKMPTTTEPGPVFNECRSCHTDYSTRERFTHVYMDHRTHAQEGVACSVCHVNNQHPGPERPAEAVCAGCHEEVNQKGACDFCHPAGTIPHFYLLGAPREGYIECGTCHPSSALSTQGHRLVRVGAFSGQPDDRCLKCHEEDKGGSTGNYDPASEPPGCRLCHLSPSHPDDWLKTHGQSALGSTASCVNCHADVWCSMACHASTGLFKPPLLPIPSPEEVIAP